MPFDLVWERNGFTVTFTGLFDLDVHAAVSKAIFDDPRSDHVDYQIFDFTRININQFKLRRPKEIAYTDAAANSSILKKQKIAIVIFDEKVKLFIESYIKIVNTETSQHMIFDDIDAARRWAENAGN